MPEYHAVALDETQYYRMLPGDEQYVERIMAVYVYDYHEETHCCEFTPSYYLEWAYTFIVWKKPPPVEVGERAEDYYCFADSESTYVHVRSLDRIATASPALHKVLSLAFDATLEDAREHVCANYPF